MLFSKMNELILLECDNHLLQKSGGGGVNVHQGKMQLTCCNCSTINTPISQGDWFVWVHLVGFYPNLFLGQDLLWAFFKT